MRLSVISSPRRICRALPAALCLFVALNASPAWAWGPLGHLIVARIAEREVGSKAASRLRFYLEKEGGIESAARWAGDIAGERPDTARWSFIHIAPSAMELDLTQQCPANDCVTVKIREFEGIARLGVRDRTQITEAVKFMIHLMGDLHQPLHAGYASDEGGGKIPVLLNGRQMSLLDAWETTLVERLGTDDAAIADRLLQKMTSAQREQWSDGNLRDWTWESHLLAARVAYGALPSGSPKALNEDYIAQAAQVIETQLMKAGVRLARILDRTWP
ncbi:MAG: S1/P1 nuclease [Bryobacterales bacterium]